MEEKKSEKGALFIEAAIVLPIFMIAMLSFVSLISLYTVHSKVQYAITQTAGETAAYTYFYSYLGVRDVNGKLQQINTGNIKSTDAAVGNMLNIIDSCSSAMNQISSDIGKAGKGDFYSVGLDDSGEVYDYDKDISNIKTNAGEIDKYVDSIIDDPIVIVKWLGGYLVNSAVENAKAALGCYVLYPALTCKYLGYDSEKYDSKDAFLKKMGIRNMDFSSSSLLPQIDGAGNKSLNNRVIDVVVTYDYRLPFSILPEEASTFRIAQRAVALSWGDGDDTHAD